MVEDCNDTFRTTYRTCKQLLASRYFLLMKKRRARRIKSYWQNIESQINNSQKTEAKFSEEEIELMNFIAEMIVVIIRKEIES